MEEREDRQDSFPGKVADDVITENKQGIFSALVAEAVAAGASDLHLTAGLPPMQRLQGELQRTARQFMTAADTDDFLRYVCTAAQEKSFRQLGEIDFAWQLPGGECCRVHAFRQQGKTALALRILPAVIPSLQELGQPAAVAMLAGMSQGLVLVTGPTGSGKSTTLAAMVALINTERCCHVITLEDPVEYRHVHGCSIINQREIGTDVPSFAVGLRAALRQDPDVILLGEMRDLETISTALTAAETGQLVLASLHTNGAAQTVDRIIDVFPANQQQQIRRQLAFTLQGIIYQQLLPRIAGNGRVAAVEILLASPAVRNLIREGKNHQLLSVMQTNRKIGMVDMDTALTELYRQNIISLVAAQNKALAPENFHNEGQIKRQE